MIRLFRKGEPRAPDGSPLSDWNRFEFEPKPDITAFELVTLLRRGFRPDQPVFFKKGTARPSWATTDMMRHFRARP
jgi:hypothetical protein